MKGIRFLPATFILVILLALSAGLSAAQGPAASPQGLALQGPAPEGTSPQAWVGTAFTYQGQLLRDGVLVNDTCTMVFSLYDDAAAGSRQGDPITLTVAVADGLFTAVLNSNGEFGMGTTFDGTALWLEVAVQCPGDAGFSTLTPRQALNATPYALSLRPAARVEGDTTSTILSTRNWGEGDGLSGRSDSTHGRGVYGWATASSGETHGVEGTSASPAGTGVYGLASAESGEARGVYGVSYSTSGVGVYGLAAVTTGFAPGVYGMSWAAGAPGVFGDSTNLAGEGAGVMGRTFSTAGRGVYGYASATSGLTYGVYGQSDSSAGVGVYGLVSQGTGVSGYASALYGETYGVRGQSDSPDGTGVYGYAPAISGHTYGLYGESASSNGIGVYGHATGTSGGACGVCGESAASNGVGVSGVAAATSGNTWGVQGYSVSDSGIGVDGRAGASSGVTYGVFGYSHSDSGTGVYGWADAASGLNYGVYGRVYSTNGYGVYSYGNFAATGSKAAIVETADYGWRHLYSMESPDVLFEDVGTAQLVDGQAVVPIDPVFAQTVNLEQPYQVFLTAQGEEFVLLLVAAQSTTDLTVRGVTLDGRPASCAFHYRIIAKRLGYEGVRLAPAAEPTLMGDVTPPSAFPEGQP